MRVIVKSSRDTLILSDVRLGETHGWHLLKDGLEGWYEPPDPRADVTPIPQQDGAYGPAQVLASHRILTIRGGAFHAGSSLEGGRIRERLAGLTGELLSICVEDGTGPKWVSGFISSQIGVTAYATETDTEFSLIVTCPDPTRYGLPATSAAVGGVVTVENNGNASVWPTFDVTGPVTVFRAVLGGAVLEWQGPSTASLSIDTRTGLPLSGDSLVGTLIHDDLFQVDPGMSQIQVSTVPAGRAVNVTVRSGWK